jgi:hypothetical protein
MDAIEIPKARELRTRFEDSYPLLLHNKKMEIKNLLNSYGGIENDISVECSPYLKQDIKEWLKRYGYTIMYTYPSNKLTIMW